MGTLKHCSEEQAIECKVLLEPRRRCTSRLRFNHQRIIDNASRKIHYNKKTVPSSSIAYLTSIFANEYRQLAIPLDLDHQTHHLSLPTRSLLQIPYQLQQKDHISAYTLLKC